MHKKIIIGILGVGYVGLPLAICFSGKYLVKSFDYNKKRIEELKLGFDKNGEFKKKEILKKNLFFTNCINELLQCNYFIIAVPTPIKDNFQPDLQYLKKANILVSKVIKKNDIIIYESTVYPGLTDDYCIPQIELYSGLVSNKDFYYGYSPERVNPGDKQRKISDIIKITSGSNILTSKKIDKLYKSVIKAGTFNVTSIKVAEAAKIIENIQRDINIALVNELSVIFDKMGVDCHEVVEAAATKWNFSKYIPGLVGGHCIGVDPYYLAYKSKQLGVNPKIILAGRSINNNYFKYISKKIEKNKGKNVLIMGISFKENCKDLRNTQVIKIYKYLRKKKYNVDIYDPIVDSEEAKKIYKIKLIKKICKKKYNYVLIAVAHDMFSRQKKIIKLSLKKEGKILDLKNIFKKSF